MRRILRLLLLLALSFSVINPASAITFGKEVTDASNSYPSVISIWIKEGAEEPAQFICSGTLIQDRIVLTAAHCVLDKSFLYYVKYGNDLLDEDSPLLEVASTWRDPRYSERQHVNDVGLLLLSNSISGARTTALPSATEIKKILSTKGVKLEVVGWGKDQNSDRATYIKRAFVDDQINKVKNIKGWRNDVWIAVGKYNSKERVYAGACNGDSGGPLFAKSGSKTVLVGVTSWGAEDCELGFPSIYVRLSYYISKINSEGMNTLFKNEVKQNRALPSALTEPKITGTPAVNSTLKCDPGTWSSNTIEVETRWSTNQGWTFTDATNPGLSLGDSVARDTQLTCTVTASSSNGKVVKTVSVLLPGKPTYSGYLSISGLSSYSVAKPGTNATCGGISWNKTPDTEEVKWFSGDTYDVKNPVISNNKTLPITNEIILNYAGKTLSCIITARNSGGIVVLMANVKLPVPVKPSTPNPSISGISYYSKTTTGTVAQCSTYSYSTDETITYQWGYGTSSNVSSLTNPIGSGPSLTITQSILNAINGKYLICKATSTNIAGSSSGFTTQSVTGDIALPAPTSVTITGIDVSGLKVGDIATCNIRPLEEGETATFEWLLFHSENRVYGTDYQGTIGRSQTVPITSNFLLSPILSHLRGSQLRLVTCQATIRNTSGTFSDGGQFLFRGLPTPTPTPTPSPSPSPSPTPTVVAPAQPTITGVVASQTSLAISWNTPSSTGGSPVTEYHAYVENVSGTTIGSCSTTGALTCTVTGLSPNTDYKVIVSAWNSAGGVNRSSGDQNSPRTPASTLPTPTSGTIEVAITSPTSGVRVITPTASSPVPGNVRYTLRWMLEACATAGATFNWSANCQTSRGVSIRPFAGDVSDWGYPNQGTFQLEPWSKNPDGFEVTYGATGGNKNKTGYTVGSVGTLLAFTIETLDGLLRWASNWFAIP